MHLPNEEKQGISVDVYRSSYRGQSEQVSNIYDDFVLISREMPDDFKPIAPVHTASSTGQILLLKHMMIGDRLHFYAVPYDRQTGGMFGGNFVYTCDSRLRESGFGYPLPVHDRFES